MNFLRSRFLQAVLLLVVAFCLLRFGIRQHWHVYGVLRDTSVDAATPALGYAANVITSVTLVFFALVMFIFWIGGLGEKGKETAHGHAPAPVLAGGSDQDV